MAYIMQIQDTIHIPSIKDDRQTPLEDGIQVINWLAKIRWVAFVTQVLCLIPGIFLGFVTTQNIFYYLGTFSILAFWNIILYYLTRYKSGATIKFGSEVLLSSLTVDLIQLWILLALTGGWTNPFSSMVFIYGVLSACILPRNHWALFLVLLLVAIASLQTTFRADIPNRFPASEHLVDALVEMFVGTILMLLTASLVKDIIKRQFTLNQLRNRSLRMDRLRSIGALSSGICHQLATPLNSVRLRINRLERAVDSECRDQIQKDVTSIHRSLTACEHALKKLAAIHVDHQTSGFAEDDLVKLVKISVNAWCHSHDVSETCIAQNLPNKAVLPLPISSIPQVILDLLDNALEVQDPLFLELKLYETDGFWNLEFIDQGPGFPKQVLQHLGEPFNSQKTGGSGLGLYHAKLICQMTGGDLIVKNLKPKGSTVTCKFGKGGKS